MKLRPGMALRQAGGIAESLSSLDWGVPDFSTRSRRQKALKADISCRDLLATSAGIKIKGRRRMGRLPAWRHETPLAMVARTSGAPWPGWREIHTGIDGKSLEIRVVGFTVSDIDDGPRRRNCRPDPVRSGDRRCHRRWRPRARGTVDHSAPQGPGSRRPDTAGAVARNGVLRRSKRAGRTIWR